MFTGRRVFHVPDLSDRWVLFQFLNHSYTYLLITGGTMFLKTILSCVTVGITIIGLLMYFDSQDATVFTIGIISYFLIALSSSIKCKCLNSLRS